MKSITRVTHERPQDDDVAERKCYKGLIRSRGSGKKIYRIYD